jgi:hypothetical protein
VEFERELRAREERLAAAEAELARRRGDLGAVELMRAALERREIALEAREAALESRPPEVGAEETTAPSHEAEVELIFVPGPGYRLVSGEGQVVAPGTIFEIQGEEYAVARIGRSPLPRDARRCAYLLRQPRRYPSGGAR